MNTLCIMLVVCMAAVAVEESPDPNGLYGVSEAALKSVEELRPDDMSSRIDKLEQRVSGLEQRIIVTVIEEGSMREAARDMGMMLVAALLAALVPTTCTIILYVSIKRRLGDGRLRTDSKTA